MPRERARGPIAFVPVPVPNCFRAVPEEVIKAALRYINN